MEKEIDKRTGDDGGGKGSVTVVGIGPGGTDELTARAKEVLARADTVVGYTRYVELVAGLVEGKDVRTTGMTREEQRCVAALELALGGRRVAVVSSGDAGVYGMAGLVLQLSQERFGGEVPVEVVPGVPAFVAASAILGAPLMHDFASVSLSDLLTPWEVIERRVEAAASADFVIAIYNPRSKKRTEGLAKALETIRAHRSGSTPVGIVRNASREDESVVVTTLDGMDEHYGGVDMSTMLIVGNSTSYTAGGRIITPRGYRGVRGSGAAGGR